MSNIKTKDLYDLSKTSARPLLEKTEYPWEALSRIGDYVKELGKTLSGDEYYSPCDDVWVANDVKIPPTATILSPTIIESGTEIRPGAYIRGKVLVGKNCVIGNSCELKNSIIFDNVQIPHFNYIGDSILGYRAHTGAGAITSNVKSDRTLVCVNVGDKKIETGLKKFGAMIGDYAEIGCNSVLNPGTVIGKNTNVYPLSSVRGVVPEDSIYKAADNIVAKK